MSLKRYGHSFTRPLVITVDGGNAYADADAIDVQKELKGLRSGVITGLIAFDQDSQGAAFDLYVYAGDPGAQTDNAAFVETAAAGALCIGKFRVVAGDYETPSGTNRRAYVRPVGIDALFFESDGDDSLWLQAVARSAPTYTNDLELRLVISADD